MKDAFEEVLRSALALRTEDRAELAEALLDSLDRRTDARVRLFERARRRALRRLREGLDLKWVPDTSREDLHRR